MVKAVKRFLVEEEAISSVEYAILLAFIAVGLIVGVKALSTEVEGSFDDACKELNDGVACP